MLDQKFYEELGSSVQHRKDRLEQMLQAAAGDERLVQELQLARTWVELAWCIVFDLPQGMANGLERLRAERSHFEAQYQKIRASVAEARRSVEGISDVELRDRLLRQQDGIEKEAEEMIDAARAGGSIQAVILAESLDLTLCGLKNIMDAEDQAVALSVVKTLIESLAKEILPLVLSVFWELGAAIAEAKDRDLARVRAAREHATQMRDFIVACATWAVLTQYFLDYVLNEDAKDRDKAELVRQSANTVIVRFDRTYEQLFGNKC